MWQNSCEKIKKLVLKYTNNTEVASSSSMQWFYTSGPRHFQKKKKNDKNASFLRSLGTSAVQYTRADLTPPNPTSTRFAGAKLQWRGSPSSGATSSHLIDQRVDERTTRWTIRAAAPAFPHANDPWLHSSCVCLLSGRPGREVIFFDLHPPWDTFPSVIYCPFIAPPGPFEQRNGRMCEREIHGRWWRKRSEGLGRVKVLA